MKSLPHIRVHTCELGRVNFLANCLEDAGIGNKHDYLFFFEGNGHKNYYLQAKHGIVPVLVHLFCHVVGRSEVKTAQCFIFLLLVFRQMHKQKEIESK